RTLGVVNFASLYRAMESTQHIVRLGPAAVELVDRTMIDLARGNPAFRSVIEQALRGEPDAIRLVEFLGDEGDLPRRRLADLVALMGDLGMPGSVVQITDMSAQKALWEVRKAGLNIMMSMKGDGKPVSFIEDCAVPLEHLAAYTQRLTDVFTKHGTRGTWYARASVGTLHVRPILDMRREGPSQLPAIAYEPALDWSAWNVQNGPMTEALTAPGSGGDSTGGFAKAADMCNNNGHCRKFDAGTMCPSFRVTRDEVHLTRGRANTLRLAL